MRRKQEASRTSMLLGLLACLLGVVSVTVSYFAFPLYAGLEGLGGGAVTGWQLAIGIINNMIILGVTPTFLLLIGWALLPVVAAALVGILGIARVLSAKPFLATLYLIICQLGSISLALLLVSVIYGLRGGDLGAIAGYFLCFVGDRLMRSARRAHAAKA